MNIVDLLEEIKKEQSHGEEFSIYQAYGVFCIGHNGQSKWVAMLDECPIDDGVLDVDAIKPFESRLLTEKGAFAVCWNMRQVWDFIHGESGTYITPQNYHDHVGVSYE